MKCAFHPGEVIHLDSCSFVIEDIIGRGSSCIVYKARHQGMPTEHLLKEYHPIGIELYRDSNKVLCVKNESDRNRFTEGLSRFIAGYQLQMHLREKDSLKNSICNVQAIHKGYGTHFIEMTVFSGKSYNKVTEESLKKLLLRIKAITQTVSAFHQEGYLLLDIKPENIFADPKKTEWIILFDFDSVVDKSNIPDNWRPFSTPGWHAPELKSGSLKECNGEKIDVYSIGMILYQKLTGELLKNESPPSRKPVISLDTSTDLLKNTDDNIVESLIKVLEYTLCSANYRWTTNKLIKNLDDIIRLIDQQKSDAGIHTESSPSTPVHVQVDVEVDNNPVVDNVKKQFSKLRRTIIAAAILICIPIFFLVFGSLLPESEAPASGVVETTQTDHLQQAETTDTVAEPTANTQTEPNSTTITEDPTTIPTHGIEESTSPSNPDNQSESAYAIDTIAYVSDNFRSLIITNDGVVYFLDGSVISNSANDISLDMQTDFDAPLGNGYLAYDPYNDIVYLLAGGSLSIYDISDLGNPKLVLDDTICPDIVQIVLDYESIVTPHIMILPDGSLLVPADLDGTYRVDISNRHFSRFAYIYNMQSPYYALLIEDSIMTLREESTEATVAPLYGGQEYAIQLECDAPYQNSICSVGNQLLFYDDGVGVCQINVDGTFSILIAQENIKLRDYQSLDYNNIWSIAANQSGVIAFYDNTLKCIRCISTE